MAAHNKIDLNSDVGESFGIYKLGLDEEVIPLITSANIACGFHAGDPAVMKHTISLAKQHGVAVGAHPGFPDLIGFGSGKRDALKFLSLYFEKYGTLLTPIKYQNQNHLIGQAKLTNSRCLFTSALSHLYTIIIGLRTK